MIFLVLKNTLLSSLRYICEGLYLCSWAHNLLKTLLKTLLENSCIEIISDFALRCKLLKKKGKTRYQKIQETPNGLELKTKRSLQKSVSAK